MCVLVRLCVLGELLVGRSVYLFACAHWTSCWWGDVCACSPVRTRRVDGGAMCVLVRLCLLDGVVLLLSLLFLCSGP